MYLKYLIRKKQPILLNKCLILILIYNVCALQMGRYFTLSTSFVKVECFIL